MSPPPMNRIPFPQLWRDSEKVLEVVCEGLTLNTSAYSLNEDVMGDLLIWGKQGRDKSSVSCSTKQLHILVITKKTKNADFPSLSWPSLLHVADRGNIFITNLSVLPNIYILQRESTTSVSPTMYPTTHPKVPCNVHVCTEDEEGLFTEVGNCGFSSNWILLYFPTVRSCVRPSQAWHLTFLTYIKA